MMRTNQNMDTKDNGFSLVELMIAMAVGAIIMTAIYASVNMAQRSSGSVGRKIVTQQDARAVLDLMSMEIRMASYNPSWSSSTFQGNMLGNCLSVTMTPANRGIVVADANELGVAMDLDSSSSICNTNNEYIRYIYSDSNHTITRSVNCSPQAILGGTGSASMVINGTGTPLFRYYDSAGNVLSAPVTASIPDIKRIRITIVVETEAPDSLTHETKTMTYTTDVLVINHAVTL